MSPSENANIQLIKDKIERLRAKLNYLISIKQSNCVDNEILFVSQDLDRYINDYYLKFKGNI